MPLIQGSSQKSVGKNIATEEGAGRPHKQAIAIALETARRVRRKRMAYGGEPDRGPENELHSLQHIPDYEQSHDMMIEHAIEPYEAEEPDEEDLPAYMAHSPQAMAVKIMAKKMAQGGMGHMRGYGSGGMIDPTADYEDEDDFLSDEASTPFDPDPDVKHDGYEQPEEKAQMRRAMIKGIMRGMAYGGKMGC